MMFSKKNYKRYSKIVCDSVLLLTFWFTIMFSSVFVCSEETARNNNDKSCLWGTNTERTTWQMPYCPFMSPEINTIEEDSPNKGSTQMDVPFSDATSPETAIYVICSNGTRYSYYYTDIIRYHYVAGNPPKCIPIRKRVRVIIPDCSSSSSSPSSNVSPLSLEPQGPSNNNLSSNGLLPRLETVPNDNSAATRSNNPGSFSILFTSEDAIPEK